MDPFSLLPAGIGLIGSAVGAGMQAAALPGKRRRAYAEIEDDTERARKRALIDALRHTGEGGGVDSYLDTILAEQDITEGRDDARNAVHEGTQLDPNTFLPIAQAGANFGQKLYDGIDYDNKEAKLEEERQRRAGLLP